MLAKLVWIRLLVFLFAVALLPAVVRALPDAQECSPPGCSEPPTYQPPVNPPPAASNRDNSGAWPGYSDGRLNPDMAEYYSVYCKNNFIEIWGGAPSAQMIDRVALADVIAAGDTGSFFSATTLIVARNGDTVTILGDRGHGPGTNGLKSFSLTECITRNGGAPPTYTPTPLPPTRTPIPRPSPTLQPDAQEAVDNVDLCLPGVESTADFIRCLTFFAPDNPSSTYFYQITWALITFCFGGMAPVGLVASVPAVRLWRRRRKP